jgi:hypothetical protein
MNDKNQDPLKTFLLQEKNVIGVITQFVGAYAEDGDIFGEVQELFDRCNALISPEIEAFRKQHQPDLYNEPVPHPPELGEIYTVGLYLRRGSSGPDYVRPDEDTFNRMTDEERKMWSFGTTRLPA